MARREIRFRPRPRLSKIRQRLESSPAGDTLEQHVDIAACRWIAAALLALIAAIANAGTTPPPAAASGPTHNPDMSPFIAAVDTNHDGCMSHAEWRAAGAPESAYRMLADKHGCVTAQAMRDTPAPAGIDLDGDGKVTLEEFLEFDRSHARGARSAPSALK
jgi:hypothetical protein